MVYIYKKVIGENPYYYLRASKRKNGKTITKDIAYLGKSLNEVQNALNNLPKYSEQIRKAYRTIRNFLESNRYLEKTKSLKLKKDNFLEEDLLEIEACKIHYNNVFSKKDVLTKKETIKKFVIEFAFNTTSIEGNTIKLNEARNLLEEGITPKNKSLREVYDLQNTEKVFLKIFESPPEINHNTIIDLHKGLMENIDPRTGYRNQEVIVIKANFKSTPAPYVKIDMDILLKWYNQNLDKLHPFVLSCAFHHKFEKIHPFMDGNGRTGRMLLNAILIKIGYPPIIIRKKTRADYLKALRIADKSGLKDCRQEDYKPLAKFVSSEMAESYWNIFL